MKETIFRELFGNSPQVKLLDFMITNQMFDYPIVGLSKNAHVGYSTLKLLLPKLLKLKIVKITRTYGKIKFYKLNTNNPNVKRLLNFDWNLTKQEIFTK